MVDVTQKRIVFCTVGSVREVGDNIFVLRFRSSELARTTLPGQFINIKVSTGYVPLLRRPFSVYRTEGDDVEIIFNAIGPGTKILSKKKAGDGIDVLGPLGTPYEFDDDFETALLVAGGLGIAPLPLVTSALTKRKKPIHTFLGAKIDSQIVSDHLDNVSLATDDGSRGRKGTVVDLFAYELQHRSFARPKIFACGPNAMLKHLSDIAGQHRIPCEVSLESTMACGFGICQGCPVERSSNSQPSPLREGKYSLVCKEGPVFNTHDIVIE